jgi:Zn-dependent peptidase ImmA (M78 family)
MIAIFPEIISTAKNRDIELLAVQVRRYFAGEQVHHPRIDPEAILAAVGIKVQSMAIEDDAVLCVRDKAGSFDVVAIINLNWGQPTQHRFLLAHLLGHFLLHVQPLIAEGAWRTSGLRETISPMHRYSGALACVVNDKNYERMEREADDFAAALLLPVGLVKRAAEKIAELNRLAAFFGVEQSVMRRRMDDIRGLGSDPSSFVEAEARLQQAAQVDRDATKDRDMLHSEKGEREVVRMPKSVAANNYQSMKVRTESTEPRSGVSKDAAEQPPSAEADQAKPKGMARIRELARQLDPSIKQG